MTTSLPTHLVELLMAPRPDSKTWSAICRHLDDATDSVDLVAVKKALSLWPVEVPRPAPKWWLSRSGEMPVCKRTDQLLRLCLYVHENEAMYAHYVTSLCTSPLLRLRDGSPAVTLWRQPRGEVTLASGQRLVLGGGQPGLADLGGVMVVELRCSICEGKRWEARVFSECNHAEARKLQLYIEVEVKLDGCIPPSAAEYVGTSKRQLTATEHDQVQRQKTMASRGGGYFFAERVLEAVSSLCKYRDDVVRRLS